MKAFLKSLPLVGPALTSYRRWKVDPARNLRDIFRNRKDLFIVQIGSNDGSTGDPIHSLLQSNPTWKALLVEPVPFLFDRLNKTYSGNPNIQFDNVAIKEQAGMATFYYVDPSAKQHIPDLPWWFDQLGSFDRGHIARHLGDALDRFTVSARVSSFPLATVLDRNHVTKIDLLHIDTEGYDWMVLRQLDLTRFRPEAILIEHMHLSKEDKGRALAFLRHDYRVTNLGADYLCRST